MLIDHWAEYVVVLLWIVLSVVLIVMASATFGRKMADIEVMEQRKVNGVRTLQANMNRRTHGLRIFLGFMFGLTGVVVLMGLPEEWRTWVGRMAFLSVLIAYVTASVWDWRAECRQNQILIQEEIDAERRIIVPTIDAPEALATAERVVIEPGRVVHIPPEGNPEAGG